jgi:hypothetical protein
MPSDVKRIGLSIRLTRGLGSYPLVSSSSYSIGREGEALLWPPMLVDDVNCAVSLLRRHGRQATTKKLTAWRRVGR